MKVLGRVFGGVGKMYAAWQQLQVHWVIRTVGRLTVLFSVLSLLAVLWFWQRLPPAVPLWFSAPWGEERLARPAWLFLFPFASVLWYVVSIISAITLTRDYPVFTRVLFLTTLLVAFLSFIAVLNILFLVT